MDKNKDKQINNSANAQVDVTNTNPFYFPKNSKPVYSQDDKWMDELFDTDFVQKDKNNQEITKDQNNPSILVQWNLFFAKRQTILDALKNWSGSSFSIILKATNQETLAKYPNAVILYEIALKPIEDIKTSYNYQNLTVYKFNFNVAFVVTKTLFKDNSLQPIALLIQNKYYYYPYDKNQNSINFMGVYSNLAEITNNYFKPEPFFKKLKSYSYLVQQKQAEQKDENNSTNTTSQDFNNYLASLINVTFNNTSANEDLDSINSKFANLTTIFKNRNFLDETAKQFLKFVTLFNNDDNALPHFNDIFLDVSNKLHIMNAYNPLHPLDGANFDPYTNFYLAKSKDENIFNKLANNSGTLCGYNEFVNNEAKEKVLDASSIVHLYEVGNSKNENENEDNAKTNSEFDTALFFWHAGFKITDVFASLNKISNKNVSNILPLLFASKKVAYGNYYALKNYFVKTISKQRTRTINITQTLNRLTSNIITDYNSKGEPFFEKRIGFDFYYDFSNEEFVFAKENILAFQANVGLSVQDIKLINRFIKNKLNWNNLQLVSFKEQDKGYGFNVLFNASIKLTSKQHLKNETNFDYNDLALKVANLAKYNQENTNQPITDLNDIRLNDVVLNGLETKNKATDYLSYDPLQDGSYAVLPSASHLQKNWQLQASIKASIENVGKLVQDFYIEAYCEYLISKVKAEVLADFLNSKNSIELLNKIKSFELNTLNKTIEDIYNLKISKVTEIENEEDLKLVNDTKDELLNYLQEQTRRKHLN